ncbi:MAG: hypothetical protein F7B78_00485 [Desulfurococcales archaeon]|nr:hypothetical protein [Desulfurococcales archaeon]
MHQVKFIGIFVANGNIQMRLDKKFIESPNGIMVRFGLWSDPTVSLGRRQSPTGKYDPSRLASKGIELVLRPTGGLTILHHPGTVTIHMFIPKGHPVYKRDVITASIMLAEWIASALRYLGYNVEYWHEPPERKRLVSRPTEICMAYTGAADIFYRGRKVAAAALRKTSTALLYQGYLILNEPWYDLWAWIDQYPDSDELRTVFGGLNADFSLGDLATALLETYRLDSEMETL